jgi:hypothetical protein
MRRTVRVRVGPGAHVELLHRRPQQAPSRVVHRAVIPHLGRPNPCIRKSVGIGQQPAPPPPAPGWRLFLRNRFDGSPTGSPDSFSSDSQSRPPRGAPRCRLRLVVRSKIGAVQQRPRACPEHAEGIRRTSFVRLVAADHRIRASALMYPVTIRNRGFASRPASCFQGGCRIRLQTSRHSCSASR